MPAPARTIIMKRMSARWVMAQADRLKRCMAPLLRQRRLATWLRGQDVREAMAKLFCLDAADFQPWLELLHAERHYLLAGGHTAGDERVVFVERGDGDRP